MKKIAIVLLASISLTLASCGGGSEKVESTDSTKVAVSVDTTCAAKCDSVKTDSASVK